MNRKEFIEKIGASAFVLPVCLGILSGCGSPSVFPSAPTNVDLTLDVSTGALSKNGGYLVKSGIIIARTSSGSFLAVSAACTHQGTTVEYLSGQNEFYCPNHGATYNTIGKVTSGPTNKSLTQYNTTLTGTSLRVFS